MRKLEFTDSGSVKYFQDSGYHPTSKQKKILGKRLGWIFIFMFVFYFIMFYAYPFQDESKIFATPDNISAQIWQPAIAQAHESGIYTLWNPYIFMGMPNLASLTYSGRMTFWQHPYRYMIPRLTRFDVRISVLMFHLFFGIMFLFNKNCWRSVLLVMYLVNVVINFYIIQ